MLINKINRVFVAVISFSLTNGCKGKITLTIPLIQSTGFSCPLFIFFPYNTKMVEKVGSRYYLVNKINPVFVLVISFFFTNG